MRLSLAPQIQGREEARGGFQLFWVHSQIFGIWRVQNTMMLKRKTSSEEVLSPDGYAPKYI